MNDEIWKDIPNYEGIYQASTLGRIKSLERYKQNHSKLQKLEEKILKQYKNQHNGYVYVMLRKDGKEKNLRVHRIIAKTFIPNLENKPQINHIDGNKQNNCVKNLEWCNQSENEIHAYEHGLASNNNQKIKVKQYTLKGKLINEFESLSEASNKTRVSIGCISQCINGKKVKNKTCGFIWKKGE